MKIPHTIPKIILRAYTHKQTPEELAAQYGCRVLRSEDVNWDEGLFNVGYVHPLAEQSLKLIIDDYPKYVQLTKDWNILGKIKHEKARAQWEIDLANYIQRKASYDRKQLEYDLLLTRIGHLQLDDIINAGGSDSDHDSSDDDADEFKKLRNIAEPTFVPDTFADFVPIPPVLDRLNDTDRVHLIEEIDIETVPLQIAVETIPDEYYWERACNERWPEYDADHHGNSWKRMFMEKHLREAIEAFHPFQDLWPPLLETIELCAPFVVTITLNNLIPECWGVPRKPIVQPIFEGDEPPPSDGTKWKFTPEDEGFNESKFMNEFRSKETERKIKITDARRKYFEEGGEEEPNEADLLAEAEEDETGKKSRTNSHIDLSLILPKLGKLSKLSIVYEMAEIGDDWEPRFFDFTMQDCELLAKALSETPTISHLELNRSRMTGEQTKILVRDGLLKMPHLNILNLNYNNLCSSGALAIARLITDETSRVLHTLHTLKMARCNIKSKGAKALAYALTLNHHLTYLDIRLNHIGNSGGKDLGHALVVNKTLENLNIAANHLGEPTCYVLGKMLHHNTTLKYLDLSSNNLGIKGGESVALALRVNKTILKLDVRLANTSLDFEYDIESHLKKNRTRCGYNLLEREDIYPPTKESGIVHVGDGNEEEDENEEGDEEEMGEGEDEDEGEEPEVITKWKTGRKIDNDDSDEDDGKAIVKKDKKAVRMDVQPTPSMNEAEEGEG